MRSRSHAVVASAAIVVMLGAAAPAAASGGEIGGEGSHYHLTDGWQGATNHAFSYGRDDDRVYVGDWNGDRRDTLAVRRAATYHFSNRLTGGGADRVVTYGRTGDVVLMGDWDGDGVDTLAVRRGATYHVSNSLRGGEADVVLTYGRSDDVVLVGDWDGDGVDTLAVRRGDVYHLRNTVDGGPADVVVRYGRASDEVVVGDWDGDGRDTLGIRRGNAVHVKNSLTGGDADRVMHYGRAADAVLVGDWDGNGTDTIGLRTDRPGEVVAPVGLAAFDRRMVELINVERARAGVPAARLWEPLREGAVRHSAEMARTGRFAHASEQTIRADGAAAGCDPSAENIAWGTAHYARDPEGLMAMYMDSPGHRRNILARENRFVAAGSVTADDGRVFNTQRFARSCS